MPTFKVIWEIDIEADTPQDAARRALEIQRDPDSIATSFQVFDECMGNVIMDEPSTPVDFTFCSYCGGNDELPTEHTEDCARPRED